MQLMRPCKENPIAANSIRTVYNDLVQLNQARSMLVTRPLRTAPLEISQTRKVGLDFSSLGPRLQQKLLFF